MALSFKTGIYTGDGNDNRAITGVGFTPKFVLILETDASSDGKIMRDDVSPSTDESHSVGENSAWLTDCIQSIDEDGFTVGTAARVNTLNKHYFWQAWGGTSVVTGSYNGNGTTQNITSVGFTSGLVIIYGDRNYHPVFKTLSSGASTDATSFFTNISDTADIIEAIGADGFTVGGSVAVNASGNHYHYVCIDSTAANFDEGTYEGNNTDDRDVAVGFTPTFVWVKNSEGSTAVGGVAKPTEEAGDTSMPFKNAAETSNCIQALGTDKFTVGTDARVNENLKTIWWVAFKVASESYELDTADTATLTDAQQQSMTLLRSDTATITESTIKQLSLIVTDAVTLSDGEYEQEVLKVVDTATLTQSIVQSFTLTVTDILALTENQTDISSLKVTPDSITMSDSAKDQPTLKASGTITMSDSTPIKSMTLTRSDTSTLTEVQTDASTLTLTNTATLSDGEVEGDTILVHDHVTLSENQLKVDYTLTHSDSLTLTEDIIENQTLTLTNTITLTEAKVLTLFAVDTITLTDGEHLDPQICEIDGAECIDYIINYDIDRTFGQAVTTCTITAAKSIDLAKVPEPGQSLYIVRNYRCVFDGSVEKVDSQGAKYTIYGKDKIADLVKYSVNHNYESTDALGGNISKIFKDLIETYGLMTASVQSTTKTISIFRCRGTDVLERCKALADAIDWQFYYMPDTDTVYFEPKGNTTNATVLTIGDNIAGKVPKWEEDNTDMINDLTVKGAKTFVGTTDLFSGNASTRAFVLDFTPDFVQEVTVGGTLKVGGSPGASTAYDYTVDLENKTITFTVAATPGSGTNNIEVKYTYGIPTPVRDYRQSSIDTYGLYKKEITFTDVTLVADAEMRLSDMLTRYSTPFLRCYLKSVPNPDDVDLQVGRKIHVVDSINGYDEWLVVNKHTLKYPAPYDEADMGDKSWRVAEWGSQIEEKIRRLEEETASGSRNIITELLSLEEDITVARDSIDIQTRTVGTSRIYGHHIIYSAITPVQYGNRRTAWASAAGYPVTY